MSQVLDQQEKLSPVDIVYFRKLAALAGTQLKLGTGVAGGQFKSQKTSKLVAEHDLARDRMRILQNTKPELFKEHSAVFNKCSDDTRKLVDGKSLPRQDYKTSIIEVTKTLHELNEEIASQLPNDDALPCAKVLVEFQDSWGSEEKSRKHWESFAAIDRDDKLSAKEQKKRFEQLATDVKREIDTAREYAKSSSRVRDKLQPNVLQQATAKLAVWLGKAPSILSVSERNDFQGRLEQFEQQHFTDHTYEELSIACLNLGQEIDNKVEENRKASESFQTICEQCEAKINEVEEVASVEVVSELNSDFQLIRYGVESAGFATVYRELQVFRANRIFATMDEWKGDKQKYQAELENSDTFLNKMPLEAKPLLDEFLSQEDYIRKLTEKTKDWRRGQERLANLLENWKQFGEGGLAEKCAKNLQQFMEMKKLATQARDKLLSTYQASLDEIQALPQCNILKAELHAFDMPPAVVLKDAVLMRERCQLLDNFIGKSNQLCESKVKDAIQSAVLFERGGKLLASLVTRITEMMISTKDHLQLVECNTEQLRLVQLRDELQPPFSMEVATSFLQRVTTLETSVERAVASLVKTFRDRFGIAAAAFDKLNPDGRLSRPSSEKKTFYQSMVEEKKGLVSLVGCSQDVGALLRACVRMHELRTKASQLQNPETGPLAQFKEFELTAKDVEKLLQDEVIQKYCRKQAEPLGERVNALREMIARQADIEVVLAALDKIQTQALALKTSALEVRTLKRTLKEEFKVLKEQFENTRKSVVKQQVETPVSFVDYDDKLKRFEKTLDNDRNMLSLTGCKKDMDALKRQLTEISKDKSKAKDSPRNSFITEVATKAEEDTRTKNLYQTALREAQYELDLAAEQAPDKKVIAALRKQYVDVAEKLAKEGEYGDAMVNLGVAKKMARQHREYPRGDKFSQNLETLINDFEKQCSNLVTQLTDLGSQVEQASLASLESEEGLPKADAYLDVAVKLSKQEGQPELCREEIRKSLANAVAVFRKLLDGEHQTGKAMLAAKENCIREARATERLLQQPLLLNVIQNTFLPLTAPRGILMSLEQLQTQLLAS